jgi:hypothetical protein
LDVCAESYVKHSRRKSLFLPVLQREVLHVGAAQQIYKGELIIGSIFATIE